MVSGCIVLSGVVIREWVGGCLLVIPPLGRWPLVASCAYRPAKIGPPLTPLWYRSRIEGVTHSGELERAVHRPYRVVLSRTVKGLTARKYVCINQTAYPRDSQPVSEGPLSGIPFSRRSRKPTHDCRGGDVHPADYRP